MALFDDSNIMSEAEFESLFTGDGGEQETTDETTPEENRNKETTEEETTGINLDNPFNVDSTPESVGSEEHNQENTPDDKGDSSPLYSSLAKALAEEGILSDSDDNKLEDIKDSQSLMEAMRKSVQAQLTEEQKRISDALNNGVEPDVIRNYETTIKQLNSITDAQVSAENEQGENLRKNIIYRDYLNKGFSEERARREVERAINTGTDIDDAKEALESIKQSVKGQYDAALKEAEDAEKAEQADREKQAASLRKSVLEDKSIFEGLEIDKSTRQKALDNIIKPIYTDPETGEKLTAIQKYEHDNRVDFLRKVGIIFTLTDGFKNLDGLVKGKVRKDVNKSLKELEHTINNTQRNSDGSLNFATGVADSESYLNSFTLDV